MRTSNEGGVRTRQEDSDDEDVIIMDSWVNRLVSRGWRAGRCELVTGVHHTTKNIKANPGQLQWSIFFFERADIDMEVFEKRLQAHPFVASSERQVEKDLRRTEAGTRPERIASLRRVLCAFASFTLSLSLARSS